MRRLLLQAATGILFFGGRERPGRQVRAPIRRSAVHRDARHRPPLKNAGCSTDRLCFLRGFLFFSSSSCDSREEATCYTIDSAIGGQHAAKILLGHVEAFDFLFFPFSF